MKDLVLIELKKYCNKTTFIILTVFMIFVMITSGIYYLYYDNTIVKSDGEIVSGIGSIRELKKEAEQLEGTVNQACLDNIVKEFEKSIEKREFQDVAGRYMMRFHIASYLLNFPQELNKTNNFSMEFDYDFLKSEKEFYLKYKEGIKKVIRLNQENRRKNGNAKCLLYTEEQLQAIDKKIDSLENNFYAAYTEGIQKVIYDYGKYFRVFLIAAAFLLCGVFSKDSLGGMDELTLASTHGRRVNMNAKVLAGNISAIIGYAIFIIVLLVINGIFASLHGMNTSAQVLFRSCIYNMNMGQVLFGLFGMGFLATILIANLVMLLSITLKYVKITGICSVALIYVIAEAAKTSDLLKLVLNPVYIATNLQLDTPLFIGNIMVPFSFIAIFVMLAYFAVIRVLTVIMYKKYTIRG